MLKAIVIGASSGIGNRLATLLTENGYKVGITGRKKELLYKLKKTNPDSFIVKVFDATDIKTSVEKITELTSELGGLDLLVLSSGTGDINEKLNFEIDKKVIDLNVTGFTNIINLTYNYFEKQGFGHVVAVSSVAGIRGSRQAPSYNASKSYQITYLEGLRQKAKKSGKPIIVTDIKPRLVDTNMAKGEGLFWVMPVEKVAKQIYMAIKKKKEIVYVTKRWKLIGILLKTIPRFIYDRM